MRQHLSEPPASRARVLWQEHVDEGISACHNYVANARVAHVFEAVGKGKGKK